MTCDVFLSYTRIKAQYEDVITPFWKRLQNELQQSVGTSTAIFKDTEDIEVGATWSDVLVENLNSAKVLLFLLSPTWLMSEWCVKEYSTFKEAMARDSRKKVFPVLWTTIDTRDLNEDQKRF
jgi:TIR domain